MDGGRKEQRGEKKEQEDVPLDYYRWRVPSWDCAGYAFVRNTVMRVNWCWI